MKLWSNSKYRSEKKSQGNLTESDRKWIILSLVGVQIFLSIGTIFAASNGMSNTWQFLLGLNLLVFAGLFHYYRNGLREKKQKLKNSFSKTPKTEYSFTRDKSYLM